MAITREESINKLKDMVEGIDFAMLTTFDGKMLRSRPMSTQELDEQGNIWFFTNDNVRKTEEIQADNHVNVAYSDPDSNKYISVSGRAELVKDHQKIKELWSPIHKAWFPKGLEDPNLALLKISVEEAEYWDSPSSTIVQIFSLVKAIATGQEANYGEHGTIKV